MKPLDGHTKWRRRLLVVVLLLVVCFTLVGLVRPARHVSLPPVIIMSQPYTIGPVKVSFLDRIMPASKAWAPLWQLRYALFGRKQNISIQNTLIDLKGSKSLGIIDCLPGKPDFESSDGLRIWFLMDDELNVFRKRLKEAGDDAILDLSLVTMGDETQAQIHTGNSILINGKLQPIGFSVDLLPRIHKATTDLTAAIVYSEAVTNQPTSSDGSPQVGSVSIQTNFALGGRFQLPRGNSAIFALHSGPGLTNQRNIGIMITPQSMPPKK